MIVPCQPLDGRLREQVTEPSSIVMLETETRLTSFLTGGAGVTRTS